MFVLICFGLYSFVWRCFGGNHYPFGRDGGEREVTESGPCAAGSDKIQTPHPRADSLVPTRSACRPSSRRGGTNPFRHFPNASSPLAASQATRVSSFGEEREKTCARRQLRCGHHAGAIALTQRRKGAK